VALQRGDDDGGELLRDRRIFRELEVVLHLCPLMTRRRAAVDPRGARILKAFAHHACLDGIEHIGDAEQHGVRSMLRQRNL
jgi:hypothetical protein